MRRDPHDIQLSQGAPDLRRWRRFVLSGQGLAIAGYFGRRVKQARFVGIKTERSAVVFQIRLQQPHVLLGRIAAYEASQQLAGGVVDHVDQIQTLAAAFQPVVLAGIPLHQLPA
jgi:hypothetical protein